MDLTYPRLALVEWGWGLPGAAFRTTPRRREMWIIERWTTTSL